VAEGFKTDDEGKEVIVKRKYVFTGRSLVCVALPCQPTGGASGSMHLHLLKASRIVRCSECITRKRKRERDIITFPLTLLTSNHQTEAARKPSKS
jgi:hypothetical protein